MAEAKTQCAACGAEMLVFTAERTAGRCRPCASGTRERLEEGRRSAQHDKAFRASHVWQFWLRLVASDFATLQPSERVYLAVNEMRGAVLNGGFYAYFSTFADHSFAAEEGLETLNAPRSLELLRTARQLMTGGTPGGFVNRPKLTAALREVGGQLDALDRQFYSDPDGLWDKLQDFGVRQRFFPERWPSTKV